MKVNIKFLWPTVKGYIWIHQFSWYIAYLAIYLVYALGLYDFENSLFDADQGPILWHAHLDFAIILVLASSYFLYQEYK